MKKVIFALSLVVFSLFMVGCKGNRLKISIDGFKVNTMAVHRDGKIQAAILEEFDKEQYGKDLLESFIKEEINEYNAVNGANEDEPFISLDSLKVDDGHAKMILTYANMEDYVTFNGEKAEYMTLAQAKSAGIVPEKMVEAETGSAVEKESIKGDDGVYVVAVNEEFEMLVQGKILYYQNGVLLEEGKVQTAGEGETTVVVFKNN